MPFLQKAKKVLEIIREQFNETCRTEIDEALMPVNKALLEMQRFSSTLGLSWLLEHSKVGRNSPEKEDFT